MDNYSQKKKPYASRDSRGGGYRGDRNGGSRDGGRPERSSSYSRNRSSVDRDFQDRGPARPSFKVVCDDCGKNTTVPFEPTSSKPVYCRDCFENHGGDSKPRDNDRNDNRGERNFDRPRPSYDKPAPQADNGAIEKRLKAIEEKLDMLLEALEDVDMEEDLVEDVEESDDDSTEPKI